MEKYYKNNLNEYLNEIGQTNFKFKVKRNFKRFLVWYFNDKFALSLNVIGIIWLIIK
jgi:hypothetical protein